MKPILNWQAYQALEFRLSPSHSKPSQRSLVQQLSHAWSQMLAHLSPSSEPHVWATQDATGRTLWNAYDPITGRSLRQVSDEEMRIWLEERHHGDRFQMEQQAQQLRVRQLCQL